MWTLYYVFLSHKLNDALRPAMSDIPARVRKCRTMVYWCKSHNQMCLMTSIVGVSGLNGEHIQINNQNHKRLSDTAATFRTHQVRQ